MSEPDPKVLEDAAKAYESLFVQALFAQWPPRLLDAAKVQPGQRVLDVACGTGVLARAALQRVGPGGHVTGLDPNPGMLAVARRLAPAVDYRSGVAETLPFEDRAFDAVMSQFGLMFFRDRVGAIREMLRVVVPGGRLAVAVWDSLANTPAYDAEVRLIERIAGSHAADPLRAPFALGDRGELAALFEAAGAARIAVAALDGVARFPSVRIMVEADLRGWLPAMRIVLPEEQIQRILREAESALGEWVAADGQAVFETPALVVSAVRAA